MPRVPKIDELQIGRASIDAPEFRAVQGQHVQALQGADVSRAFRAQQAGGGFMPAQRAIQAIQASDQPSRDQMQMGQAMAAWGDLIREIGLRESDEVDRARVQEGINAYMEQSLDAQQNKDYGWQTMQAANALGDKDKGDLATQRQNRLKGVREKLLQNLGNERQKEAFNRLADEEDARANKLIGQHVLRESERNKREQLTAGIAIAGKMMQTDIAEQRDAAFAKVEEHIAQLSQLDGLSGEALVAKRQEMASPYVRAFVAERINAYDREGAAMMLAKYEDYLTASDKVALMDAYKTMHEVQTAREAAQADFAGGDTEFAAAQTGDPYAGYNHGFNAKAYVAKLVDTESGGKNRARPIDPKTGKRASSAYGRAQFIDSTWRLFGKSPQGAALKGNMSDREWLEMRSNPQAAEQATLWYAQENKRAMDRHNIPFNNLTAYLFHFGGEDGGRAIYEAHPDTPLSQVLSKRQIEANSDLVARTKTTGALIAYFAKKMGVPHNPDSVTGRPQPPERMTNSQLKAHAQALFPDNPKMQQTYISTYATGRDVEIEAQDQARAQALSAGVTHIWSGGKVSELQPEVMAGISPEDLIKLYQMEGTAANTQEAKLKQEGWQDYINYSQPDTLTKMSREQVIALAPTLGRAHTERLVTKWDALHKSGGAQKAAKLETDTFRRIVNRAFEGLIDPYNPKKEHKAYLAEMRLFVQERINEYTPALLAGEITQQDLHEQLYRELQDYFSTPPEVRDFWFDKGRQLKPLDEVMPVYGQTAEEVADEAGYTIEDDDLMYMGW